MDQKPVKASKGKEKNRQSGDMETSRFSIRSKTKPAEPPPQSAQDKDAVYSVVSHMERTLFIVDLSKLEAEGDTLVGSLVMYRPLYEFKKSQYEQRCSQVIGLSLCMKNLTGKYPKFLHMRGTGFAIQGLGDTYFMGLASRPDEPGSCAVQYLETVCNVFRFYYHSPNRVMQNSQGDWEVFTTAMSSIFNSIMNFITADQHSVPAMLKPLPYLPYIKKNQQTYMLAMRMLQTCQKYAPILGGSIMYSSKLVVSQFPPSLMEMLVLVGGGGLELDKKSILEDNIAPGKVWVLEVYLTREEVQIASDQRKDLTAFQATYASMDTNPNLSNATLHWRFQSSISSSKSSTESIKMRKSWGQKNRRRVKSGSGSSGRVEPVASSTPNVKQPRSGSLKSEEAVMFSPGLSSVTFNNDHVKNTHSAAKPRRSSGSKQPLSPTHTGNDTDELYLDAVDVDPTAAIGPEMLRMFSRSISHPSAEGGEGSHLPLSANTQDGSNSSSTTDQASIRGRLMEVESQVHATGSTSSEGFATPSPTPPRKPSLAKSQLLPPEDPAMLDATSSFKTACDLSLHTADEEGGGHEDGHGGAAASGNLAEHETTPTVPCVQGRNHSESDDDFVDSEDIEKILQRVAKEKKNHHSIGPPSTSYSPPPPPIPRRGIAAAPPISIPGRVEEAPPTPPVRGDSAARNFEQPQKDETPPPPVPRRLPTHSSEPKNGGPMVTGILDQAEGYPYLPSKPGEQNGRAEKLVVVGKGTSDKGQSTKTWIYDTLKRCDKYTDPRVNGVILGGGEGEGRDGGSPLLSSTSSHEATPLPTEEAVGGGEDRTELHRHFDDRDYEDIDGGEVAVETRLAKAETGPPKIPDRASTGRPKAPVRGTDTQAGKTSSGDGDYEEIDDVDVNQASSKTNQDAPSQPARPAPDMDYEEIDDLVSGAESGVSTHRTSSSKESEGESVNAAAKGGGNDGDNEGRDIGNAALYLEHDDEIHDTDESKNSSMTVTLDLSHIAKDDIMYGSRDKKMSSSVDISRITIDNGESSAEEAGGDGTVTPVELTYNESMFGLVKAKLEQQRKASEALKPLAPAGNGSGNGNGNGTESGLNDSAEYSSLPDEDENVFMNSRSHSELEDSLPDPAIDKARKKTKTWLPRTLDRRTADPSEKVLEKYCLYVQQYMNTFIILLADSGLQHQHSVLDQLWRLLTEQLIKLDMNLDENRREAASTTPRTTTCVVSYSGYENMCEAHPESAAYHFRHAVRRAHQEYLSDPSLCQISLSKEHCRMLTQRVHDREIFYQPGKLGGDALSLHGMLERQAKLKCSLRQQPIGGPKIMFI